eukprot:TRINITY_DN1646_c0_g2_i1.p1 TRINITY_DN1646_c0_g2~~TRINITY_DN1646_c0_g2_i1.p1  ORF type:complete len:556 (+),score=95.38 TRINITY_DN1646_c0_g2_i1:118-1668(+)
MIPLIATFVPVVTTLALASGLPQKKTLECMVLMDGQEVDCGGAIYELKEGHEEQLRVFSKTWWTFAGAALVCIACAATAAGLTLGLTSLDVFELQVLLETLPDDVMPHAPPEVREEHINRLTSNQRSARKLLPLISGSYFGWQKKRGHTNTCDPTNQHYLLVTLLLLNATANEALPLFFDKLMPAWLAIVLSVSVVLIFGEIVPSAIFTGPKQLLLAAKLAPVVRVAKFVFIPIVWPMSLFLDKCLGHDEKSGYSKAEMKGLVRALRNTESGLAFDEANMLHGVLEMHHKTAKHISFPIAQAKSLPRNVRFTQEVIGDLRRWGHSRCFIAGPGGPTDICGVFLIKKLLGAYDTSNRGELCIDDLPVKMPVVLHPNENLLSTLDKFQRGGCHLAVISEDPDALIAAWTSNEPTPKHAQPTMFCSLEDVIEEMLKEEIYDEEDVEHGRDWCDATAAGLGMPLDRDRSLMRQCSAPAPGKSGRSSSDALTRSRSSSDHQMRQARRLPKQMAEPLLRWIR